MTHRLLLAGLLLGAVALGGCPQEEGRPPVARFDVTPAYVPLHDGYATVVTLDGSRSKDEIDDPTGALPLGFRWVIDDPAPQVVQGSLDAAQVQIKVQGDRPTQVTLTVSDPSGRTGVRIGYVGVTAGGVDGGTAPGDGPTTD